MGCLGQYTRIQSEELLVDEALSGEPILERIARLECLNIAALASGIAGAFLLARQSVV